MKDRILGYTVIGIIILLLFVPIGYLIWQSTTPKVERTIVFKGVDGLSFLAIQDPVRVLGVEVGLVKSITHKDNAAHVTIETTSDLTIFNDYKIEVLAKGVMGERFLTINTGTPHKNSIPVTETLYGTVSIGPDQALSYIGLLAEAVHQLTDISEKLRSGSAGKKSLISQVWAITAQVDTLVTNIQTLFITTDSTLSQQINNVTSLIDQTDSFVATISDSLPSTVATIETLITDINTILIKVDPLISQGDHLVEGINSPDHLLWKTYQLSLRDKLTELQLLIKLIANDSLTIPVRLW